jgi:hypothetical protein
MPDLDIVERKLPPEWRRAYKLIKGSHELEAVAEEILKALARTLRDRGGAPGLEESAQALYRHDRGFLDDRSLVAFAAKLEQEQETANGKVLALSVMDQNVSGPDGFLRGAPNMRLAKRFLVRLVERCLFAQQRDYLVGKRFTSRAQAVETETRLLGLMESGLSKIASQLAEDSSAKNLRAPRSAQRKKSTRELLDQPL